ncbi:hypothetical protein B0H21DRAFT_878056 [Amylocystis lapponica]|nr:hypothetical protein B0H21DRAFT_878056 [Amylocystis lapponica]
MDSEELARFRKAWQEEVRKKKAPPSASPARADPDLIPAPSKPASDVPHSHVRRSSASSAHAALSRPPGDVFPPKPPLAGTSTVPLGPALSKAIEVYRRAVQCEQRSELDEALRLYRMAFRMDPHVDRAYHKVETQHAASDASDPGHGDAGKTRHGKAAAASSGGHADAEDLAAGMQAVALSPSAHAPVVHWPRGLTFEPEDEQAKTPLQVLPDELLVLVLRNLDASAVERFATVNRKARVVSLDATIWRYAARSGFVRAVYKPPQIADDEDVGMLLRAYMEDHRRLYIEHPRVRLDGVYIAVCHYIRAGLGESAWMNVSHLITYHRYLRFYPNGQVLSLLANEELPPQQVISVLKPTLRMKGLFIGSWQLDGTMVRITDLLDPSGGALRYTFQMMLELRSRPLGRWNRLDFRAYDSTTPLALKHERSFWFSRVRSYV